MSNSVGRADRVGRETQIARELEAIVRLIKFHPEGLKLKEIADGLDFDIPYRRLRYRIRRLLEEGRIIGSGGRRWYRYQVPSTHMSIVSEDAEKPQQKLDVLNDEECAARLSVRSRQIHKLITRSDTKRQPVEYNREFLANYRPNVTMYLSHDERVHLEKLGRHMFVPMPAGTYARRVLSQLLIDLPYNSSRLEGSAYSLLDTKRLLGFKQMNKQLTPTDAHMILNHKQAIEFLVDSAEYIRFDRMNILNLHGVLAAGLLGNDRNAGRLRTEVVDISGSGFKPASVPQVIQECFDEILTKADAIANPYEQAFFVMVHIPYLQPFIDVNKRVSRLAANIPLIRENLSPLSYIGVPTQLYLEGILAVYELNEIELLKDVFIWAYERSAQRYSEIRLEVGEPDPFEGKYRLECISLVKELVQKIVPKHEIVDHIARWGAEQIPLADQEHFSEFVEDKILSLHEGNFMRFGLTPAEFQRWEDAWRTKS